MIAGSGSCCDEEEERGREGGRVDDDGEAPSRLLAQRSGGAKPLSAAEGRLSGA
jgi:hypothetical protein